MYVRRLATVSVVKCVGYFYVVTVDFLRSECWLVNACVYTQQAVWLIDCDEGVCCLYLLAAWESCMRCVVLPCSWQGTASTVQCCLAACCRQMLYLTFDCLLAEMFHWSRHIYMYHSKIFNSSCILNVDSLITTRNSWQHLATLDGSKYNFCHNCFLKARDMWDWTIHTWYQYTKTVQEIKSSTHVKEIPNWITRNGNSCFTQGQETIGHYMYVNCNWCKYSDLCTYTFKVQHVQDEGVLSSHVLSKEYILLASSYGLVLVWWIVDWKLLLLGAFVVLFTIDTSKCEHIVTCLL